MISRIQRIETFVHVGIALHTLLDDEERWDELCLKAINENPWFTEPNLKSAVLGIIAMLEPMALNRWAEQYSEPKEPKTVGLVMAGNLPFVGFHDVLCVLISGHNLMARFSSTDSVLAKEFFSMLKEINPAMHSTIQIVEQLKGMDAVIATGSDNTSRYFDYYFSKYPHVIRKNRNSCAVITGLETDEEVAQLGQDIFQYYGLGCRSVSKLLIPKGYDITRLFPHWEIYKAVIHHHRYANNYEYQKSLLLINSITHLDTGFLLIKEEPTLASAISVLHYEFYEDEENLHQILNRDLEKTQCIAVSKPADYPSQYRAVPFGTTQSPTLWDYADGVDVMDFLCKL